MNPKFSPSQIIRHINTGHIYVIVNSPIRARLESTDEPAYLYERAVWDDPSDITIWARSKKEVEDGRFEIYHQLRAKQ